MPWTYDSALLAAVAALVGFALGAILVWRLGPGSRSALTQAALLRQDHEWFRTTLANIGDAVIASNANGKVTFLNAVAQSLTGWTQEEARGAPLAEVFKSFNEKTRQILENPAARALREGAVVEPVNHTLLIAKDGTETCVDDNAAVIRDENGVVVGAVLVFRDVTDRKRVEIGLRHGRERLDMVQRSIQMGVWYCDLPFDKLIWNAKCKEHFGLPPDAEVSIATFYECLHPDDRERTRKTIERSIAEQGDYDVEYRTVAPGGRVRWIRAIGRPFCDEAGKAIRFDGVTVDMTGHVQIGEALKEANRRKDEFLATLAHELRNPLAPLYNGLQILRLAGNDGKSLSSIQDMMARQLAQMVRLVDDLLDMSRIDRGKIELRNERLNVATVIESALETSRPLIEAGRHELIVRPSADPVWVTGDLTRLAQVVGNLLNNSAKYTPEGGHIWLTVERRGDQVLIRVRDDGMGIPCEMVPKIFDMFTQVDRNLKQSQGGLGIGLTLVRRLVEMHEGKVEAVSEGAGRGCEFIVTLPLAAELTTEGCNGQPNEKCERGAQAPIRRILVVDDNKDSAESLSLLLQLKGNEVKVVHDGPSALEAMKEYRPAVVLLDIGLPGMSGHEVARKLRETQEGKGVVLIAQTGWGQEEDRQRSTAAGFDAHLVKPLDFAALQSVLAKLDPAPAARKV
jgi:PAS domain S-box-containing protein